MKRPQKVEQDIEFRQIIEEIISNEKVKEMKKIYSAWENKLLPALL